MYWVTSTEFILGRCREEVLLAKMVVWEKKTINLSVFYLIFLNPYVLTCSQWCKKHLIRNNHLTAAPIVVDYAKLSIFFKTKLQDVKFVNKQTYTFLGWKKKVTSPLVNIKLRQHPHTPTHTAFLLSHDFFPRNSCVFCRKEFLI